MSTTALSHAVDRVTTGDVARLAGARAWPSISILLDTTWGDEMSEEDERRLAELVERAEGRLRDQGLRSTRLVATLRAQAEEATREPTGRGLVIFVSQAVARRVRLPVPVRPRVVVERTFATRDLVQMLHRTPPTSCLFFTQGVRTSTAGTPTPCTPCGSTVFPSSRHSASPRDAGATRTRRGPSSIRWTRRSGELGECIPPRSFWREPRRPSARSLARRATFSGSRRHSSARTRGISQAYGWPPVPRWTATSCRGRPRRSRR